MDENFFIGIFLLILGTLYCIWNLKKKAPDSSNIFSKTDVIYSWGLVFILILSGLIMIFKHV